MNMQKFRTVVSAALIVIVSLIITSVAGGQARKKLSFSIATGGTGGVWYPLGGAIGGVIGKYVPDTEATSEATTAAIDNMKLLGAGKTGMAFAYDYHIGWANEGKVPGIPAKYKIRLVMGFYEQPFHIVTTASTGITSVMQLKGKRVSVGAPNSGTEEQADYVLKALGIDWNKDIKKEKLGAGESVAALEDGRDSDRVDIPLHAVVTALRENHLVENTGIPLHDLVRRLSCHRQQHHLDAGGGGHVDDGAGRDRRRSRRRRRSCRPSAPRRTR